MHTNIDKTHLNEFVGKNVLGLLHLNKMMTFIQVATK